jgi:hypothetical protein
VARSGGTYQKGQSGNLAGRPKGRTFREAIRAELGKPDPGSPKETRYEVWARRIVEEAAEGDNSAKMEVIKFLEGSSPADKGDPPEPLENQPASDVDGNTLDP